MATVLRDVAPKNAKLTVEFAKMIRTSGNATMVLMQARPERGAGGRPRVEKQIKLCSRLPLRLVILFRRMARIQGHGRQMEE